MLVTLLFICPLLVQCAPSFRLVSGDTAQVKLSAIDPSTSPNASSPSVDRPVKAPDPIEDIGSNVSPPTALIMAYYPDWVDDSFRPEGIPCHHFDWIDFAFAVPTENMDIVWDDPDSGLDKLTRLVTRAHGCGTNVKLSVGGWTGSKHFSSAVGTPESRALLANNILEVFKRYNLDGIDIDWEYPGLEGAEGNQVGPEDSDNLLSFLRNLRSILPASACITAAAQAVPFMDAHGEPMSNLSQYAAVLNWTMLMNYDVWGSSPSPGPNAPMYDGCQKSEQPQSNAVAAFNQWNAAGFSPSQLVLGVPSYGYVSSSSVESLRERRSIFSRYAYARSGSGVRLVGEDGTGQGQIMFRELLKQGALVRDRPANATHPATFVGDGGFTRYWDSCSATPFLRSPSVQQVVAYDDPESLAMKAEWAACVGMRGVNLFDTHGDTEQGDLTLTIRKAFKCIK